MRKRHTIVAVATLSLVLVCACQGPAVSEPPTPTGTATPVPTATPTPTPTPTAMPASVSGDPRIPVLSTPFPQANAPCGVVDLFDFPIDPPDGLEVTRGGGDYGMYRSRFGGYHAGEDWGGPIGRSALGSPVYSIGHGAVTYAEPLGWGADQGVVIIRHTFADGSSVLSFYGHLDPNSVVLSVGDCVARGDRVGLIGRPRTSPHLHFEIRTHMPTTPGPGYWSESPTLAGWLPPSQTIWDSRIAVLPGVQWTRSPVLRGTTGAGTVGEDTFVATEEDQLVGIGLSDGGLRWAHTPSVRLGTSSIIASQSMIYVRNRSGRIEALRVPDHLTDSGGAAGSSLTHLWELETDLTGVATTLPLPGGGLLTSGRQGVLALAPDGEPLWRHGLSLEVFDWVPSDDRMLVSTISGEGSVIAVDSSGLVTWTKEVGGHLAVADDQVWIYGVGGVYRLDPESHAPERVYILPTASLAAGDIVGLPEAVVVAHRDRFDSRLIALNLDGTLRWERSIAERIPGRQHELIVLSGQPFLVSNYDVRLERGLALYAIDLDSAELTQVFAGGTRNRVWESVWWTVVGADRILVNIGRGTMCLLDPLVALEAVSGISR